MATQPFINRSQDVTAGWTMNIAMNVYDNEDWCQIPMDNYSFGND
jgi:nucleoside-specific outer membrane channel protein Tsx